MNFFEDQRQAKQKTNRLMRLFFLMVFVVATLTGLLFLFSLGVGLAPKNQYGAREFSLDSMMNPEILTFTAMATGIVMLIILLKSWWEISNLKSDPTSICHAMGAKVVPSNSNDFKVKQYRNIVEEMSIASSVPVPKIFILEDPAINAFACGYDINAAAICVTTGCIESLDRDELQAVVAHEYSHILNGDMTINIKLIGMLSGLVFIYHAGYYIMRSSSRSRRSKDSGGAAGLGLGLMVLGGVGFFCGSLLKAAISRQREYLADASSVQFTRNPQGITGALKKIFANSTQGYVASPEANQASHMFLVDGVKKFFSFATHPDLFDRIKAVDANFDANRFKNQEIQEIREKMQENRARQETVSEPKTKESHQAKLEKLMPLFVLYQGKAQVNSTKDLLVRYLANEDEVTKSLTYLQREELLEKLSGDLAVLDKAERDELHQAAIQQIGADGKIDFEEFLSYAYLKPALKPIKISTRKISKSDFIDHAQKILSFVYYLDEIPAADFKTVEKYFPFKLISKAELGYSLILKSIEALRFASMEQKEQLVRAIKAMVELNADINEKERAIFHLVCQMLSIPGKALD